MGYTRDVLTILYPNIVFIPRTNKGIIYEELKSHKKFTVLDADTCDKLFEIQSYAMRRSKQWVWFTCNECYSCEHALYNCKTGEHWEFDDSIRYKHFEDFKIWYGGTLCIVCIHDRIYAYKHVLGYEMNYNTVVALKIKPVDGKEVLFDKKGNILSAIDIVNRLAEQNDGFVEAWKIHTGNTKYIEFLTRTGYRFLVDDSGHIVERSYHKRAGYKAFINNIVNFKNKVELIDGKVTEF